MFCRLDSLQLRSDELTEIGLCRFTVQERPGIFRFSGYFSLKQITYWKHNFGSMNWHTDSGALTLLAYSRRVVSPGWDIELDWNKDGTAYPMLCVCVCVCDAPRGLSKGAAWHHAGRFPLFTHTCYIKSFQFYSSLFVATFASILVPSLHLVSKDHGVSHTGVGVCVAGGRVTDLVASGMIVLRCWTISPYPILSLVRT